MVRATARMQLACLLGLLLCATLGSATSTTSTSTTTSTGTSTTTTTTTTSTSTSTSSTSTTTTSLLPGWSTVTKGAAHSCALDHATRTVKCWGDGAHGQLGHGLVSSSPDPVTVEGAADVVAISAGGLHACAVELNGEVKCWGDGRHGQLGHGGLSARLMARPVPALEVALDVSAGGSHTCALEQNGTVKCWGWNEFGQLGHGSPQNSRYPRLVKGLSDVVAISAGGLHTCAVEGSGLVRCWGFGSHGQLAHGSKEERRFAPGAAVPGVEGAEDVACGHEHSCARLAGGAVRCWGRGIDDQLQAEDHRLIWEKTARYHMTLQEAVDTTFWTSPLGSAW